ncbi:MAG: Diguanylate cyclase protein, partial [Frankiales bacterium]|nr:Diguanylate cyclase protein [Frankiales bacterium]
AAGACLLAARRAATARVSWALLAAGSAAWSLGGLLDACHQLPLSRTMPFPSWACLGALLMPLCAVAGLLRLPGLARGSVQRVRLLLDGLVVASALLVLLWLTPAADAMLAASGLVGQLLAVVMPALDVVAVSIAVVVVDRMRGRPGSQAVTTAVAVGIICTSEAVYVAIAAAGAYTIGGPTDLSWCAGFALLTVAALRAARHPEPVSVPEPDAGSAVESLRLLPLLPVALAAVALVASGRTSQGLDAVLTGCLVLLGGSLSVRQYLLHGENAALHRSLEATVEARTAQLRTAHERERERARTDELTGLGNRAALLSGIAAALAGDGPVAVVLLDLDGFKAVNDGLGHEHGDNVLVAAAQHLRAVVRDGGLARLGGDEFACVLTGLDSPEDAVQVAERLVAVLRRPLTIDGREVVLGASAGVAVRHDGAGCTPHDLLREADTAMYAAKRAGGSGVRVFDPPMQAAVLERVAVESDLHVAVREGQVELHYQPVQDLRTGRVVGVEALARWDRPGVGPVAPDVFIPAGERTGLIVPLERHLLDLACRQLAAWQRDKPSLRCGVNLSPRHLREPDVVEAVLGIVDRHGLERSSVIAEVTEGLFFSDEGRVGDVLQRLSDAGITLALDDFGTGWSSLSRLTRHPFRVVKVDRSFLAGLVDARTPPPQLLAALAVARELQLDVVAEGVETQEQLDALAACGCDFAQGYHVARPGPAALVTDRVLDRVPVPVPTALRGLSPR